MIVSLLAADAAVQYDFLLTTSFTTFYDNFFHDL